VCGHSRGRRGGRAHTTQLAWPYGLAQELAQWPGWLWPTTTVLAQRHGEGRNARHALARPSAAVHAWGARHGMDGGRSTAANQREDLHRWCRHRTTHAPDKEGGVTTHQSGLGTSACTPKAAATLRLAAAREGRDGGVRPILRCGGVERFAAMASHGGAPAEERGDRA
jgi:hypothetical protein